MFHSDQYRLIDFGRGMKLESFDGAQVVRDCPAAEIARPADSSWIYSGLPRFDRTQRAWLNEDRLPDGWCVRYSGFELGLKPTPFGHVGLFPEQAENWKWIANLPFSIAGMNALNLFGYTGGTTLCLAALGASVVHLDASRPAVQWARENAMRSHLQDRPVRWIVDDATKFAGREVKRGNRFDIVVADPPTVGHAQGKMTWQIDRDLESLLDTLNECLSDDPAAVLLTCHSPGFDGAEMAARSNAAFRCMRNGKTESGSLDLRAADGRVLNCGHFIRWQRQHSG